MSFKKLTFDHVLYDEELYSTYYVAEEGSEPSPDAKPLSLMKVALIDKDGIFADTSDPENEFSMKNARAIVLATDEDAKEKYAVLHPNASGSVENEAIETGASIVDVFTKTSTEGSGRKRRKARVTRKKRKASRRTRKYTK